MNKITKKNTIKNKIMNNIKSFTQDFCEDTEYTKAGTGTNVAMSKKAKKSEFGPITSPSTLLLALSSRLTNNFSNNVSNEDIQIIKRQLKREPKGIIAVISRCEFDCPQVIQNDIVIEGKPFPTLYWLTCPIKIKAVSKLEGQGWADKFKQIINSKPGLKSSLIDAHNDYRARRRDYFKNHNIFIKNDLENKAYDDNIDDDISKCSLNTNLSDNKKEQQKPKRLQNQIIDEILKTGIGGVKDIEGIKCLHAHYAHYLATGVNPIGKMVDELIVNLYANNLDCKGRCKLDERC